MIEVTTFKGGMKMYILVSIPLIILFFILSFALSNYKVCFFDIVCISLWMDILILLLILTPLVVFLYVFFNFEVPYKKVNFSKRKKFILGDKKVIYNEI